MSTHKFGLFWVIKLVHQTLGFDVHVVFLIGSIGNELSEEIRSYGDILQLNFTESHYMLPIKDIAYLNYIRQSCPEADFVFKGDDDILLVPENIGFMIKQMQRDKTQALGHVT